ncbi:MAG: DUF3520 domain-containing protein [Gelidibacter sp.]
MNQLLVMQSRHSKYDNIASINDVLTLAESAKNLDKDAYRAEFIRLV